jgi:hypothetical protein
MLDKLRSPEFRHKFAIGLFFASLVLWPLTHVLMVITDPAENSWVFHVLLAISWFAITLTAMDIMATTDVRKKQD